MERDWCSASEEDAADTASLQPAQGVPKQCKFNIYSNITRKGGSFPSEPFKIPTAKFFIRYLQWNIDFSQMLSQRCHLQLPHPASHVPLPPRAPSWGLWWDQSGSRSPALLGTALDAAVWSHPWALYITYFLYFFAQKVVLILLDHPCWFGIISMLWGKLCSGLSVLLPVRKYLWSKESTHIPVSKYSPAHVSVSLLQFLQHWCEELPCLPVLKGLSISPVKFWKCRGVWNL